jgi:hypothetical protein
VWEPKVISRKMYRCFGKASERRRIGKGKKVCGSGNE